MKPTDFTPEQLKKAKEFFQRNPKATSYPIVIPTPITWVEIGLNDEEQCKDLKNSGVNRVVYVRPSDVNTP